MMEQTVEKAFKYLCIAAAVIIVCLITYQYLNPSLQDVCSKQTVNYTMAQDYTVYNAFTDQDTQHTMVCTLRTSDSTYKLCGYDDPSLQVCLDYHYGSDKYGQLRNMIINELVKH